MTVPGKSAAVAGQIAITVAIFLVGIATSVMTASIVLFGNLMDALEREKDQVF